MYPQRNHSAVPAQGLRRGFGRRDSPHQRGFQAAHYAHFAGKEELFVSLLEEVCERLLAPLVEPGDARPLRDILLHEQARACAAALLRPDVVAMHRLFVAEGYAFPGSAGVTYKPVRSTLM